MAFNLFVNIYLFLKMFYLAGKKFIKKIFHEKTFILSFDKKTYFLKIKSRTQIFIFALLCVFCFNIFCIYKENINDLKKKNIIEQNEELIEINKDLEDKIQNIEKQLNFIHKYMNAIDLNYNLKNKINKDKKYLKKSNYYLNNKKYLNEMDLKMQNKLNEVYTKIKNRYDITEEKIKDLDLFTYNYNYRKTSNDEDFALGGPYINTKAIKNRKNKKNKDTSLMNVLKKGIENEKLLSLLPFSSPTDGKYHTSSNFGYRIDPWKNTKSFHNGIDIVSENGNILSTTEGVVTFAGEMNGYGNLIEIKKIVDGNEVLIRFGHAKKIFVKQGDFVKKNQLIGLQGNEGRSTSPHIHYEVKYNNIYINPKNLLNPENSMFNKI